MKILTAIITVTSALMLASTAVAAPKHKHRVTPEQNQTTTWYIDDDNHASYWNRENQRQRVTVVVQAAPQTKVKKKVPKKNPVVVAKKYEGLHEKTHRAKLHNLMSVDPVRTPWCAGFVNAVLYQSGVNGTNSLMARSFLHWGYSTRSPREGDIVVFTRGKSRAAGHVGFYMGEEVVDGVRYILVLGGNQNRAVTTAYYPANRVLGFRTFG